MANNYTFFSTTLRIPDGTSPQAKKIVEDLEDAYDNESDDGESDELGGCTVEIDDTNVTVYSEGAGDIDVAVSIFQALLDGLQLEGPLIFEWAATCSKPRPGEFGGGAVIIRRGKETVAMDTSSWATEYLAKETTT